MEHIEKGRQDLKLLKTAVQEIYKSNQELKELLRKQSDKIITLEIKVKELEKVKHEHKKIL